MYRQYWKDFSYLPFTNIWSDVRSEQDRIYVVQTVERVIQRCMLMTTDPGDLMLDPTCGSGTTAYVAEQWGRRWITIDTSRVALALARTTVEKDESKRRKSPRECLLTHQSAATFGRALSTNEPRT
jgi:adenine-specific DNA-methyltransferase